MAFYCVFGININAGHFAFMIISPSFPPHFVDHFILSLWQIFSAGKYNFICRNDRKIDYLSTFQIIFISSYKSRDRSLRAVLSNLS